jgi:hypothetical protein
MTGGTPVQSVMHQRQPGRFLPAFSVNDRIPCSKKVEALGATVDNYPNSLSGLTNSAPSLTGGKSFLRRALGAVMSANVRKRAAIHSIGRRHQVHELPFRNDQKSSSKIAGGMR